MKIGRIGSAVVAAATFCCPAFTASAAETLKTGVIAPLTGAGAPWGTAAKVSTEVLGGEVNAEGCLDVDRFTESFKRLAAVYEKKIGGQAPNEMDAPFAIVGTIK
jgi:hypothetical protein